MGRRQRDLQARVSWFIAALLVLATSSILFPPPAIAAPSLQLDPAQGPPGTSITVTGRGFAPLAVVEVAFEAGGGTTVVAGLNGNISVRLDTSADAAPGDYTVEADPLLGSAATATFTVMAVETPTTTTTTTTTSTTTTTPPTTSPTTTTTIPSTTTTTAPPSTQPSTSPPPSSTTPPDTTAPGSTAPDTTVPVEVASGSDAPPAPPEEESPTTRGGTTPASSTSTSVGDDPMDAGAALHPSATYGPIEAGMSAPPDLVGGALRLVALRLATGSGAPGTTLHLTLEFDRVVPGLSSVHVSMAGEQLGDPVSVEGDTVELERQVPDLVPGVYSILVISGGQVLDEAEFRVLDSTAVDPDHDDPTLLVGSSLALLLIAIWGAIRSRRSTSAR